MQKTLPKATHVVTILEMLLARSRGGRVILHVVAIFGDGEFTWHARGVLRELR
jgi:hypothetical protein